MDGLLIVDKPSGPTSHDVVARVRRLLGERRVGHTGTLDPLASGVLPLVVGRATRLARFLSGSDKTYEAEIRLGVSTDTCDALGQPVGAPYDGPWPGRAAIETALDRYRGTFLQQPPAFSAKKIEGRRSYELARRAMPPAAAVTASSPSDPDAEAERPVVLPAPVRVTAHAIELLEAEGPVVRLRLTCSAGFYVRALADDLGAALGTGAHLTALRRTASAGVTLAGAIPLEVLEAGGGAAARTALVPMDAMLESMPAVTLVPDAVKRALNGRDLGPSDAAGGLETVTQGTAAHVRLLDPAGRLVGIAERSGAPGLLHPAVVLM
jgi:tRNA pseudouridine55 synthase